MDEGMPVKQWYEEYSRHIAKESMAQLEKFWVSKIIPEITRVVDKHTGRTATVHKILPQYGVQVWVKQRGMERENWPWSWITIRRPKVIKRYPRPFRFARLEPSKCCHCKIGRMEVEDVEKRKVICTRCKKYIGTESYPNRFKRASEFLLKAALAAAKGISVQKGVSRRTRKVSRRSKTSRKVGIKGKSPLGLQPKRRSNAKKGTSKARAKRKAPAVPKNKAKAISAHKGKTLPKNKAKGKGGRRGRGKTRVQHGPRKTTPIRKKTADVQHNGSPPQVQEAHPVDSVASGTEPSVKNDIPGSGSGGTPNAGGMLPPVP